MTKGKLKELNLIVETFLNTAELRATRCQSMRIAGWSQVLEVFLTSNDLPRLQNFGTVSAERAERIDHGNHAAFDARRKEIYRRTADGADELDELKRIADVVQSDRKGERDA